MVRVVLQSEPDVVVFDIHLPHQDGLSALAQIYQERVVAAVAITADPDSELVRRAMEEHVLGYLVKPVDEKQLRPALQVAWARFQELHVVEKDEGLSLTHLVKEAKPGQVLRLMNRDNHGAHSKRAASKASA